MMNLGDLYILVDFQTVLTMVVFWTNTLRQVPRPWDIEFNYFAPLRVVFRAGG